MVLWRLTRLFLFPAAQRQPNSSLILTDGQKRLCRMSQAQLVIVPRGTGMCGAYTCQQSRGKAVVVAPPWRRLVPQPLQTEQHSN